MIGITPLTRAGMQWSASLWTLLGGTDRARLERDDRRGTLLSRAIEE